MKATFICENCGERKSMDNGVVYKGKAICIECRNKEKEKVNGLGFRVMGNVDDARSFGINDQT